MDQQETDLFTRLAGETGRIEWQALQPFFAKGQLVFVAPELDLVAVAAAFGEDDATRVRAWMDDGRLARVSDDQAMAWHAANAELWAVVVRPWILVQEVSGQTPEGA